MRSILTHIAIVSLQLHITLGCCAHHGHAASVVDCSEQGAMAGHMHQHAAEEEPCSSEQDEERRPSDHCDDLQCSFLSVAKMSPTKSVHRDVWLFGWTRLRCAFVTARPVLWDVDLPEIPPLAVRGHVLLQVFLI